MAITAETPNIHFFQIIAGKEPFPPLLGNLPGRVSTMGTSVETNVLLASFVSHVTLGFGGHNGLERRGPMGTPSLKAIRRYCTATT